MMWRTRRFLKRLVSPGPAQTKMERVFGPAPVTRGAALSVPAPLPPLRIALSATVRDFCDSTERFRAWQLFKTI